MNIKTNYFLRNMIDLNIDSLSKYLEDADFNYVIVENLDCPIVWVSDRSPVVFGDEAGVMQELYELGLIDNENVRVYTEAEFIADFCMDAIAKEIAKLIKEKGFYDGVNFIYQPFSINMNNVIDIDGMTDIICLYSINGKDVVMMGSNDDDTIQDYIFLNEIPFEVVIRIINELENIN